MIRSSGADPPGVTGASTSQSVASGVGAWRPGGAGLVPEVEPGTPGGRNERATPTRPPATDIPVSSGFRISPNMTGVLPVPKLRKQARRGSGLLRQPGGFEGAFALPESLHPHDLAVPKR